MKKDLFCFLMFMPFLFFFRMAAAETACPEASLLTYGIQRYQEKQWDLAASGLDRFLFFCPDDARRHAARTWLALCRREQGEDGEAVALLREVNRSGAAEEAAVAGLLLASLFSGKGEGGEAVLWAENVARSTEDAEMRALALWIAGGQFLKAGDPRGAALRWERLPDGERTGAEALWRAWREPPQQGRKSPFLAGLFGLVPGGGYVYTGRTRAGVMAFGLTLGMGAAAWEAFDQDLPVLGTLLGLVTLGFYGGSMKGGMAEARLTNRNLEAEHEAAVLERFRKEAELPIGGGAVRIAIPF